MKQHKNNNIFIKTIACFCAVLILCLSFNTTPTKASVLSNAVLDSGSAAERQFWEKVKIIKSVFPNAVDDVALAATVLYNGSSSGILSSQYDKDFDKNEYQNSINSLKDSSDKQSSKAEGDNTDILIAATIVMIDSSGGPFGTYSDENYEKALAGTKLVGNLSDDMFNSGFNAVFCGAGALFDTATTPFQFIGDILTNKADTMIENKARRYYNMANICTNGFIGGTVENVRLMEDKEKQQATKNSIARGIIQLAELYRKIFSGEPNCVVTTSGNFSGWKQTDAEWGSVALGNSTVSEVGCLITSIAIQMARSGTKITNLPKEYSTFNPGALATIVNKNGGFDTRGNFQWNGFQDLASNWKIGDSVSVNTSDNATLANKLSAELALAAEGKYQKYIVLQIHHDKSSQHWVAVDSVLGNKVTIFDPGASGNTLDDNYSGWVVDTYRVMYATDVAAGGNNTNSSYTEDLCGGVADLEAFLSFVAYVEGVSKCNYKGKGDGTGYSAENLGDGAGMTTAFGITQNYSGKFATQVGYSGFNSDISSGCTDKTYIDLMYPLIMQSYIDFVKNDMEGTNLKEYQIYTLASVAYNTGTAGSYEDIANKIKSNGVDSYEVFDCMKSHGCGWTANFDDGLVRRRMAEYEVLKTGNFNAAKPTETYSYFSGLNTTGKWQDYMNTHWPTSR
ncbi:MAG: hypothetical protein HFH45_01865 [Bacilli bacterium]|nr:hypothetical protein [Bacilli bacterium]